MKKCPKCGNSEFLITPHVTQTWKVDGNGNYLETTEECVETTYIPDDDIWTCAREGCDWSGVGSECNEKNAGEEYMTEDEYTEIRAISVSWIPVRNARSSFFWTMPEMKR